MLSDTILVIAIILVTILVIVATVIYYNRRVNSLPRKEKPKIVESISFYVGVIINIPLFVMAIYSLYITRKTFIDAQKSGPKQQAALDGSRKALESVINTSKKQEQALNTVIEISSKQKLALDSSSLSLKLVAQNSFKQQKILEKNLEISSTQLDLIKEQQRVASLKPKLVFVVNEQQEGSLEKDGITLLSDTINQSKYKGFNTFTMNVKVKNVGGAVALNPLLKLYGSPSSLFRSGDDPQYLNTDRSVFTKYRGTELPLFDDYTTYLVENVDISVPDFWGSFYITFQVACYGVPNRVVNVKINVLKKSK